MPQRWTARKKAEIFLEIITVKIKVVDCSTSGTLEGCITGGWSLRRTTGT